MESPLNKKALLITYYWPPSGGSPVLRWLKFTKYLPEYGWDISVYTPDNPVPQAIDEDLLHEVPLGTSIYKTRIKEPANSFGLKKNNNTQATGFISGKGKKSLLSEIAVWIRGNIFIPDARMCWIRPSVKKLTKLLKQKHFDTIITTGPPHSMHLIGLGLKQKTGIKWMADFRDPWTNIDYYPELKLTKRADKKQHRLEKAVLENADVVVTVSPTMTQEFVAMGARKVVTITNGYDEPELKKPVNRDCRFSILHLGSMPKSRNPEQLWPVLGELVKENQAFRNDLKIHLIGKVDASILEAIKENGLNTNLFTEDQMPNQKAIQRQQAAQVLLLVINNTPNAKGILTNKFFEYMMVKRPILCVGPTNGDAASILKQTGSGRIFDYSDQENLKAQVQEYYNQFKAEKLEISSEATDIYSRKKLAGKIASELNKL
ncbi:MAG TPA: glycosyl transferase family 1 [Bacteroidales bacterium]|jgi:hypothetical protein|nr:glycosyl transferase family 1 [Bacteroidales bacterium]